ncbi:PQQ-dependent sugar dehydrogenase [Pedobacter immunditicola]|uniref:PQQ-dependent sugar dehydrogenase n=1 Tax=Pedobacter immunditicola TaxID=3133440 RepID=UPI00309FB6EE
MKFSQPLFLLLLSGFFLQTMGCKNQEKDFGEEEIFAIDSTILSVSVIAAHLNVPWDIAWGPDESIFMTEQSGTVSRINVRTGEKQLLLNIPEVWRKRTSGLLGMALHPDMKNHPFVFVDYTTRKGKDSVIFTKLVRYNYENDTLTNAKVLLEIEGAQSHNGSRLAFSKDGKLLWATGDLQKKGYAQDSTNLFGKILRINIDGSVPADNPIKGSLVYAWGFRNMQGLAVARNGNIFTSEHGDALEDELNLIKPLQNYGWPEIEGFHDQPQEQIIAGKQARSEPVKSWTPTIAPAGIDLFESIAIPEWENSILLTTLKGKALRVLQLGADGQAISADRVYLEGRYGRLRDVCVSPSGDIYISTSNQDWNPSPGFPKETDDRILRIRKVRTSKMEAADLNKQASLQKKKPAGLLLYNQYCASCHKENGIGVEGTFPPLLGAKKVLGSKYDLASIMLNGLPAPGMVKDKKYEQNMPAFNFLTDLEVAEIATYIRSSWGNNSTAVSVADIKKVRK